MRIETSLNDKGLWRGATILALTALSACGGNDDKVDVPLTPPVSTGPLAAAAQCSIGALQAAVPSAVLTAASAVTPSTGTAYCRVDGYVTTQGPAATSNQVRFTVALPPSFQARYYFAGEGGSAGYLPEPSASLLSAGYAVAGSDAGSTTPGVDWAFATDRTKAYDYAQRGVHVGTAATQALVKAFYGMSSGANANRRLYRYIDGCSGGGRMGVVAASWYPEDFDGVVAGAPGISVTNQMFFGKVAKYLIDHPDAWISPAQLQALDAALLQKFDAADGAVDGLISDPSVVSLDATLRAAFTPAQQALLDILVNGMNDFGLTYPGYTLGNPNGWSAFMLGATPPPWSMNPTDGRLPPAGYLVFDTTSRGLFGAGYDFASAFSFDNSADVNGWNAMFESVFTGSGTAKAGNLNAFFQRGGKMLFWHGTADNGISLNDTFRFFSDLASAQGGQAKLAQVAQLYTVPGLQHCGGGAGPQDVAAQALPALAQWVEAGTAPTQLVANRAAGTSLPARTFLLCPHPQRAVFKGGVANSAGLNVNDASNWSCQAP
ncbi:tannase/feruloyl esterase family alpha/beta hydrolase [Pelomonas sp. KK5]|uniref:tannase/feruloyl esterase family alpha/beta hydrolase n=1 Tax=Pelomonas sp. KK5 TaxID=1855730 RepID=UPI001301E98B|nr:tannase/feruloyl esterase family alpha/beta hydrolase [Pelomonas sp. KK5]